MEKIIKEQLPPLKAFTGNLAHFANGPSKKMFMIQCDNSPLLPKAALLGWEISGISEDNLWIEKLKEFICRERLKAGEFICGCYKDYNISKIAGKFDLLLTSGLLLHMTPEKFMNWIAVTKKGGLVYSIIPNCNSLNGKILEMFDHHRWQNLYRYSTETFDILHQRFDLTVKRSAIYTSGVNIHMLVPWNVIGKKCRSVFIFKLIKYIVSFFAKIISPMVKDGNRTFNSLISGIYEKKAGS